MSDHAGDELFAKFYAALDEINFFKTSPAGAEDPDQLSKASQFFDDALLVLCFVFVICLSNIFRPKGRLLLFHLIIYIVLVMKYGLSLFRRCASREEKWQA